MRTCGLVVALALSLTVSSAPSRSDALGLPSKEAVKAALSALKGACSHAVDVLGKYDFTQMFLTKASVTVGECRSNFQKGFLCSIPEAVLSLADAAKRLMSEIWNHKKECLGAVALTLNPAAAAACGSFYLAQKGIKKVAKCFKALRKSNAKKVLKVLWKAFAEHACKELGSAAADAVIAAVSEGASAPAAIARRLARASKYLSKASIRPLVEAKLGTRLDKALGAMKAAAEGACR